jgi:hypothetical protein
MNYLFVIVWTVLVNVVWTGTDISELDCPCDACLSNTVKHFDGNAY